MYPISYWLSKSIAWIKLHDFKNALKQTKKTFHDKSHMVNVKIEHKFFQFDLFRLSFWHFSFQAEPTGSMDAFTQRDAFSPIFFLLWKKKLEKKVGLLDSLDDK